MKRKTYLVDLDGTIIKFKGNHIGDIALSEMELNPGVFERMAKWIEEDSCVIITTARPDSMRKVTEEGLAKLGITYHHIIFGIGTGPRICINDAKIRYPDMVTAQAYMIPRDSGFEDLDV
jgi:hypothetical protein